MKKLTDIVKTPCALGIGVSAGIAAKYYTFRMQEILESASLESNVQWNDFMYYHAAYVGAVIISVSAMLYGLNIFFESDNSSQKKQRYYRQ